MEGVLAKEECEIRGYAFYVFQHILELRVSQIIFFQVHIIDPGIQFPQHGGLLQLFLLETIFIHPVLLAVGRLGEGGN
jgi:hypothetical protein